MDPLAANPSEEARRLAKLRTFEILHTPPEPAFDRITQLAAAIFRAPIALISLVDKDCQWFKARQGLDVEETTRDVAFCGHAIRTDDVLVVPDATKDPRFQDNPLVTGPPFIRFYAGAPLIAANGLKLGTACIIDTAPRPSLSEEGKRQLEHLAAVTMHLMELRRSGLFALEEVAARKRVEVELETALAEAQAANAARDHFLAMVSHEMRTPLNGIMGLVALARNRVFDRDAAQLLDDALGSSIVLRDLINDLIDAAQIEAGSFQLRLEATEPLEIVSNVVLGFQAQAREKNITVRTESNLVGVTADLDPKRIRQVLTNLVGNAIKFTQAGEVVVGAHVRPLIEGVIELSFTVRDTGPGLSEKDKERVFDRFVTGDSTSTRSASGAGLGLSISRELVRLMGGEIGVESRLGEGSRFWFKLQTTGVAPAAHQAPGTKVRPLILIAEDHPTNRYILTEVVKSMGWEPVAVENGALAVEATTITRFDAILMDIQMPVMDGVEAMRRIRAAPGQNSQAPILAITATNPAQRENLLAAGFTRFVSKPVLPAELVDVLENLGIANSAASAA